MAERIEDASHVVGRDEVEDAHLACVGVDFHLRDLDVEAGDVRQLAETLHLCLAPRSDRAVRLREHVLPPHALVEGGAADDVAVLFDPARRPLQA